MQAIEIYYSLGPQLRVTPWPGASFKKCKEKLVEKISGMYDPFFYIEFIIKYEWIELVKCDS